MRNGFQVIDADRHVIEPAVIWKEYLDPKYRDRLTTDTPFTEDPGFEQFLIDGKPIQEKRLGLNTPEKNQEWFDTIPEAIAEGFSAQQNLKDMDREGIDVAVMFPTVGLIATWQNGFDVELAAAMATAYNRWISDYCSTDKRRLRGMSHIPVADPKAAIAEIERAAELGLVGMLFRPNPLDGRTMRNPDYLDMYRAAAANGLIVGMHAGGRPVNLTSVGKDRTSLFTQHIVSHPFEQMLACLEFCGDGILEQVPDLRVGFFESGCSWVPFILERLDEHWEHTFFGDNVRATPNPPSWYFKNRCVISAEAGEHGIRGVIEEASADVLVMASDYPHPDVVGKFPDKTVGDLLENDRLSDDEKRRILWDNPARFFGLTDLNPAAPTTSVAAATH